MSFGEPDNREILRAIEKLQRQVDDLQKRMQENQRLFSPEHIAQMSGYVLIKNDLNEIKQMIASLTGRSGGR